MVDADGGRAQREALHAVAARTPGTGLSAARERALGRYLGSMLYSSIRADGDGSPRRSHGRENRGRRDGAGRRGCAS